MSLVFRTATGECMGIAQRLAFEERLVYRSLQWSQDYGRGIVPIVPDDDDHTLVSELWIGGLCKELSRDMSDARCHDFAKNAGLLMGNPEPSSRQLGVLVWYRHGNPLPPAFLVLQDERHLAGDWGVRVSPSAMVVPVTSPGKAYRLAHGRLAPLLQVAEFTGPLIAWHSLGAHGPVITGFESHLGGLPVHASLELLDVDLYEFLLHIYGEYFLPQPVFREEIGTAILVSVPPWPCDWPDDVMGHRPEVNLPPSPWVWPLDLRRDDEGALWVAGHRYEVAHVSASDAEPRRAADRAIKRARAIRVKNAQVRCDALRFAPHYLKVLDRRGYLK